MLGVLAIGLGGLAVGTAVAIAYKLLTNALSDADELFANKPVGSPTLPCSNPPGFMPALIDNGADIISTSSAYKNCPKAVHDAITSKTFSDSERNGIKEVMTKYQSLIKCKNNPLQKIGRTNKGISKDTSGCIAETSTMGECFNDKNALILTDAAGNPVDFKDRETQFKGTVAHEVSHILMNKFDPRTCTSYSTTAENPLMQEYRKAAGWDVTGMILNETNADKCPTNYGKTNPQEDLAESTMLYMYDPNKLKKLSPSRYKFINNLLSI